MPGESGLTVRGLMQRLPADEFVALEVIRGVAAAQRYGPEAAEGTVVITLKKGWQQRLRAPDDGAARTNADSSATPVRTRRPTSSTAPPPA